MFEKESLNWRIMMRLPLTDEHKSALSDQYRTRSDLELREILDEQREKKRRIFVSFPELASGSYGPGHEQEYELDLCNLQITLIQRELNSRVSHPRDCDAKSSPSHSGSATWRSIREDFESLPPAGIEDYGAEWSLLFQSRPAVAAFIPVQIQSQWSWFHPTDPSLRARASAIFLKAAKARGYEDEDQWLDELRYADYVGFQISGGGTQTLPDGTIREYVSGVLKDSIKHSITLCHKLEAGDAPKPLIGRLPREALARFESEAATFTAEYLPKLRRELPTLADRTDGTARQAELLRELAIHHFEMAARESMTVYDSAQEFEAALRVSVAPFVRFNVSQYQDLSGVMRNELTAGFLLFVMGAANPSVRITDSLPRVGAILRDALEHSSLELLDEAAERFAEVTPGDDLISTTSATRINASKIRLWMEDEGYTTKTLATAVYTSQRTIISMLNDGSSHGRPVVTKVASLMGCDPEELYEP